MTSEKQFHRARPFLEEPLENTPPSRLRCQICEKVFSSHTEVGRHEQTGRGVVEGREAEGS